jgi:hypothetical protein
LQSQLQAKPTASKRATDARDECLHAEGLSSAGARPAARRGSQLIIDGELAGFQKSLRYSLRRQPGHASGFVGCRMLCYSIAATPGGPFPNEVSYRAPNRCREQRVTRIGQRNTATLPSPSWARLLAGARLIPLPVVAGGIEPSPQIYKRAKSTEAPLTDFVC